MTNIFKTEYPINPLEIAVVINSDLIKHVYRVMLSKKDEVKTSEDIELFIEYFKNNSNDIFHSAK